MNDIERNREIVGDKFGSIRLIGVNTAHLSRGNDHYVRLGRSQKSFRLLLPLEIGLLVTGSDHVAAAGHETTHDRGADHAAVTRNVNSLIRKIKDLGDH